MTSRRQALIETAVIFALFCLQGAWPVPDVNEPQYLGKAIHFWNPAWGANDFYLNTADANPVFDWTLGWLSLLMGPCAFAWTLRTLSWLLLAWTWRRLSAALVARPWCSVLAAAIFLFLWQHCSMAGEWIVGGAEAKPFAYALVLAGLEAIVRGRWRRGWLWLGGATAMHPLVGGWSAVAAGVAWLATPEARRENPLGRMAPALVGGLLLAAPGLVPALALDWRADPAVAREAHEIYVFGRLPHHLNPFRFHAEQVAAFLLLTSVWLLSTGTGLFLRRFRAKICASPLPPRAALLAAFVNASLLLVLVGLALRAVGMFDPCRGLAAGFLRFYWFRLADVAVPLGVALVLVGSLASAERGRLRRLAMAAAILLAGFHVSDCLVLRLFAAPPVDEHLPDPAAWRAAARWLAGQGQAIFPRQPRADRLPDFRDWKDACRWVARSGRIPETARFLTPRMSQTFIWYTGRGQVATWKDLPQDAVDLVRWWQRIADIYGTGNEPPAARFHAKLSDLGERRLGELALRYNAQYAITEATDPPLRLPIVYSNHSYVVYKLRD